jgi:hypothetical protein
MPTPRPPGVRRTSVKEEQFVHAPNKPAQARALFLRALGFRFARMRSLRSTTLRLAYARRNVLGRRPLCASLFRAVVVVLARRPGALSSKINKNCIRKIFE